ncbi:YfbK domain-containing protein [Aquimarina sp. 2201CG1-2-11]|uniref:YfbK domain-containing protein n=1 Tax=Aquimarina discodermiae TaxID=3231043 RepID=UPI003462EEEA
MDFNFAASIGWFAMKLRNSKYCKNTDINQIIALADSNKGDDDQGYRSEFIRLINNYQGL